MTPTSTLPPGSGLQVVPTLPSRELRAGAALPFSAYERLAPEELDARIAAARADLGKELLLLCHHYQQDDVYRFADLTGDSFRLARLAAERTDVRWIVFCGVHFMAESADVLTGPEQTVILPDMAAGCSMADMADRSSVETAWNELTELGLADAVMPVTYMNSAADLKAFCGERGGIVCTSSNADAVLRWSFERKRQVLFFPDQHLGRNTGRKMGIGLEEMALWNPAEEYGGNDPQALRSARLLLWKGHCSVHQIFQPQHVDYFRAEVPGVRILVHPECRMEVVDKADLVGSTEFIIRTVTEAEPGSRWAIGTEVHLVHRLRDSFPDREVHFLSPTVCMCSTMYRIDPEHLLWVLENLREGCVVNRIRVPDETARWARVALQRMLEVR
ncbi:MAG: quinolinate synthase NadA [Gemmatimonadetes bacterium]|nr:quinolinate synthase NadA [Gemmatimonadota bacterium]